MSFHIDNLNTGDVTLKAPASGTSTFTFPPNNGTNTYVLSTDGAGTTSWVAATGGSVTTLSVVSANGFAGSVANATTTPAITLTTTITGILKGNGTAISAATSGTDYSAGTSALATGILKSTTSTGALTIAVAADFPTLNQNTTGTASNVTGTVAIGNGGTGQTTASAGFNALSPITTTGDLIIGNGSNSATRLAIGSNTQVLTSNGTTASWATPSSASPGGNSTSPFSIQYNNGGAFGGSAKFRWNDSSTTLIIGDATVGNSTNTITAPNGVTGTKGNNIIVSGGFGGSSSAGGDATLAGGGGNSIGGDVYVLAGGYGGGANKGGNAYIRGGAGNGGGDINLDPGAPQTSGNTGGAVNVSGGNGSVAGTNGGSVVLAGGTSGSGGTPGSVTIKTGNSGTNRLSIDSSGAWLLAGSAGTSGNVLTSGGAGAVPTWAAPSGAPAGQSTSPFSVQYNNGGAFGGSTVFTWDNSNGILYLGGSGFTGTILEPAGSSPSGIALAGGNANVTTATGGSATFSGGTNTAGTTGGPGGLVIISGGAAAGTGNNAGGNATLKGGNSTGTTTGSTVTISAGRGGATGTGGSISITGGAGGTTSGTGGAVTVAGGTTTSGPGGAVTVAGGNAVGTNQNGSSVTIQTGTTTGSGTGGVLIFKTGTTSSTEVARFDAAGNLQFSTTGQKIIGDFDNATIASRVAFQTTTTNQTTNVGIVPNGTNTLSVLSCYNNSTPTNSSTATIFASSTTVGVGSGKTGTGTLFPFTFLMGGTETARIDTNGNFIHKNALADQSTVAVDAANAGSTTITNNTTTLLLGPTTTTIASYTITFPSTPIDGQIVRVTTAKTVTALTLSPNGGQTIVGTAPTTISAGSSFSYMYNLANTSWYPLTAASTGGGGGATITPTTSGSTFYPTFVSTTSGTMSTANIDNTLNFTYVPSTGTVSAANFTTTSDVNLKDNIAPLNNALETVKSLNGKSFNFKGNEKQTFGFIAQEVEKVLPQIVDTNDQGFKSVNYLAVIAQLVEAVKTLEQRIVDLESE